MRRREGKHVHDFCSDYNAFSVKNMVLLLAWWISVITFIAVPWCEAVQVQIRDNERFAMLFQSVVLPCQYTSTSTHTPVVQWWFKSFCRDRTRDSFSFPVSLGVRGSELGPTSHLDCSDSSRTVRAVASGQGSSLTIAEYYKDRDISIINKADLRIGELHWGDSGVYYCKVVIADDLEGPNEAYVELLVLEWVFVGAVVLGSILFFVLAGVCWCQCCPHSCCCYVQCCCCPETCCCPRHLYEAGKGIKTSPSTPVAIYPPYYMQGMPAMVPIPPPSLIEPKVSAAPSIDSNIPSPQQSLVHSGYRLQPTPDQNSLKVLQYVERELVNFNPSKSHSSHDSCSMSELSSLHEAETDFHQAYRKVQKKALPSIPDMDDLPAVLSRDRNMSSGHTQTSARHPPHRANEDHLRWNPRSEHLQRKAFNMGGRTGSLDELEEFAMGYVQRRCRDDISDDEAEYMTCAKQRHYEHERELWRERELERDRYPNYSSKRYYPKDVQDRPRPHSPAPLSGNPKRRGTGDSNLRRDHNAWDSRRQEDECGQDYDDALLNRLLECKAKAGRSLSSKGGRNDEESDRPSKNSSQKSNNSHSPSNRSASNRPTEEGESLPPYVERESERFRGSVNSHQPLTSTRSRKEQENREELSRPRKVTFYDEQNAQVDSDLGFLVTVRFVPRFDNRK
ncbi:immunoglobulin-like domain-containing receptor 2 isoform X4 [Silurus meridionalis]|uniref:immunoglobulin-like domain-containing receptor 2 isoform X4 n=1 Tax=Silurus meridionalis TaxID=175797 RepID=UPI001EEC84A4|nr:immunoglobulin-like domain-containing receptor 2 isoform X4 [Silurus meridionalis]